ncbi:MAG TPA: hypothetical protein VH063_06640 [Gaiellaceae bacterium]|jgi:hypothetical protein|nr:hypothetical protein [Gaiellaceae bacterium]
MVFERVKPLIVAGALAAAASTASAAQASAPPVGSLPAGHTARIQTVAGELVAVALPHRAGGKTWRVARAFDSKVVTEASEADVGKNVVLVFRANGKGTTRLVFALTRGESAKAFESRTFVVNVS